MGDIPTETVVLEVHVLRGLQSFVDEAVNEWCKCLQVFEHLL